MLCAIIQRLKANTVLSMEEETKDMSSAGGESSGPEVIIYTTPTCVHCKAAKEFFAEHNIQYTEYDVTTDSVRRQEAVEKSGQMGVPVIFINGEMVIGFDKDKISELLGIQA